MTVRYLPKTSHSLCPYLVVNDPSALMEFATAVFGAIATNCMRLSDGSIMHAELNIGDASFMLGQAREGNPPRNTMLHVYVEDADVVFAKALAQGAEVVAEVMDQFYGDRSGAVRDSQGNEWWIATQVEELSEDQIMARLQAMAEH